MQSLKKHFLPLFIFTALFSCTSLLHVYHPDGSPWAAPDFDKTGLISFSKNLEKPGQLKPPLPKSATKPYLLALENSTEQTIKNIKAFSEIDTSSADSIVKHICANAKSDREKAEALWKFVIKKVKHWYPVTGDNECHDPVKLINIYGYGLCDDSARALAGLWQTAGLKSRSRGLGGHVVPEVYYDNEWHVYDPDHRVFYSKQDGTVAGIEYLADHPEIIENTKDPTGYNSKKMANLYATKENNNPTHGITLGHKLLFDLIPGEVWTRFKTSNLGHIKKIYPKSPDPKSYSNCIFVHSFKPRLSQHKRLPQNIVNFKRAGWLSKYLKPSDPSKEATIIYDKKFPFVVVSASVTLELVSKHGDNVVAVFLSRGKEKETKIGEIKGKFKGEKTFDIPKPLINGRYHYKLTIKAKSLKARHLKLRDFQIKTICQSSPSTFPNIDKNNSKLSVFFDNAEISTTKGNLVLHYYWGRN